MAQSSSNDSFFRLPDIRCQFSLAYHKNGNAIAAASDKWFENGCVDFTEDKRRRLYGLKAGQLTAFCYHNADDYRLRVVCDFMNFLFHLDDLSDGLKTKGTAMLSDVVMNALDSPHSYRRSFADGTEPSEEEPEASKLARDYWGRCIRDVGLGVQTRFCQNMHLFFKAVESEATSRDSGSLPDIESYMILRRDNSGCKPCFDLLEYALDIDLPEVVTENPIIQTLTQCVNDFIALSNDVFSYNVEQSRGDMYNIVVLIMKTYHLNLQDAVDRVANMCHTTLEIYHENKAKLPSWGPQIDKDVAGYVRGLEDWVAGSLRWSFMSERYFGSKHDEVQGNSLIELLPPRQVKNILPNILPSERSLVKAWQRLAGDGIRHALR